MTHTMHLQEGQGENCSIRNLSDDELILTKYRVRCKSLENQKMEMLRVKEHFQMLNAKNCFISKSLLKLKMEYEVHKADLSKTLFKQKLSSDKQQILSRRKINEFLEKRKNLEEYFKMTSFKLELEELINRNNNLQDQWRKMSLLLDLTKNQYEEIMNFLLKTFKMKVCEFCDTALKLKAVNHSV